MSFYYLGFTLVSLVTAPFSEEFGRLPLYVVFVIVFALMHLMIALFVQSVFAFSLHVLTHDAQWQEHSDYTDCKIRHGGVRFYGLQ